MVTLRGGQDISDAHDLGQLLFGGLLIGVGALVESKLNKVKGRRRRRACSLHFACTICQ